MSRRQTKRFGGTLFGMAGLGICLACLLVILDVTALNVALPALRDAFGTGASTLQWVVDAYTLVLAAGLLAGAALGGRLGERRVFLAGVGLFTVASAACAAAPSTDALLAARVAQGADAALAAAGGPIVGGLVVAGPHASYLALVVPLAAAGAGMSLTMPAATVATVATVAAIEAAEAGDAGLASGALNAARQVGGVIGVALLGTLAAGSGMRLALAVSAGAFALGAVVTWRLVDRPKRAPARSTPIRA